MGRLLVPEYSWIKSCINSTGQALGLGGWSTLQVIFMYRIMFAHLVCVSARLCVYRRGCPDQCFYHGATWKHEGFDQCCWKQHSLKSRCVKNSWHSTDRLCQLWGMMAQVCWNTFHLLKVKKTTNVLIVFFKFNFLVSEHNGWLGYTVHII